MIVVPETQGEQFVRETIRDLKRFRRRLLRALAVVNADLKLLDANGGPVAVGHLHELPAQPRKSPATP